LARARELVGAAVPVEDKETTASEEMPRPCPCCGGRMTIIEIFARAVQARAPP
jgi:hypothetical protein